MGADAFQLFAPLSFFEKASEAPGRRKRIGGIISTEKLDKQGEIVIQKGLDFTPFLEHGWFNDNHKKGTDDVLGYPDPKSLRRVQKGERLPDGNIAPANCTWAEGYLLDTERARNIWELGKALEKGGGDRRLGYSIEGNVQKRTGPNRKTIAKALVRHVAITNVPVGMDTRLECLAKSLEAIQEGEDVDKALTATGAGAAPPGTNPSAQGPTTGEGAGRILQPQSLESKKRTRQMDDEDDKDTVSKAEVMGAIQARFPGADAAFCERAFRTFASLAEQGLL